MTTRAALALLLTAGACAHAQPLMQTSYSWSEVIAGTTTPVSEPNGRLDLGEGALITLNLYATINGTDARGQNIVVPYNPPRTGTVRGIGIFTYDLTGTGEASGTWSNRAVSTVFDFFDLGQSFSNGSRLEQVSGVQFPFPGATVNATNPIQSAWRGVWNPSHFSTRIVHFAFSASVAAPLNQQNALDAEVGIDPNTGGPLYSGVYVPTNFGSGIDIPISDGLTAPGTGRNQSLTTNSCYVNCDHSTAPPILNANDFQCFLTAYASGLPYANCDHSTAPPILNANDFQCFLTRYAAGCG